MGATPICPNCGYQFRGFFMPEMVGEKCPVCGAIISGTVHFADGQTVDLDNNDVELAQAIKQEAKNRYEAEKPDA